MVEAPRLKAKRRDCEVLLLEKSSKGQAHPDFVLPAGLSQ